MTTSETHEVTEFVPDGGVLVGDDGSECAAVAVRAAAKEAALRGLPLHVIRAWSIMTATRPSDLPRGVVPSVLELEASTLDELQGRVRDLVAETGLEGQVDVQAHVVHAAPSKALVAASQTADLLVVGTRGRGGFKHLLLGSVADQCIRYAGCTVLVVRG